MVLAVLLFGKRLPEIAKSVGKGMVEFKKGLRGMEDEFHGAANPYTPDRYEERQGAVIPGEPTTAHELPRQQEAGAGKQPHEHEAERIEAAEAYLGQRVRTAQHQRKEQEQRVVRRQHTSRRRLCSRDLK